MRQVTCTGWGKMPKSKRLETTNYEGTETATMISIHKAYTARLNLADARKNCEAELHELLDAMQRQDEIM